jgi:hypothetical protein
MRLLAPAVAVLLALAAPSVAAPDGQTAPLAQPGDLKLRLSYTRDQSSGQKPRFTWKLTLRNRTGKTVRLAFATGKYADVLLSRRGATVYQWSRDKGFTQALWDLTLRPHAVYARTFRPEEIDVDSLEPGWYQLRAYVTGFLPRDPPVVETRRWFWVFDPGDGPPLGN